MSEAKGPQEPSMEEILASIRRIISEDAAPAVAPEAVPSDVADDVLELTTFADEPPIVPPPPPPPIVMAPPPPPPPIIMAPPPPAPLPEPKPPVIEEPTAWEAPPDRLISRTTEAASVAALAAIGDQMRRKIEPAASLGNAGITLEEIVRELLRPMLRDWLDTNLPGIVERLVAEEVRRLSRGAAGLQQPSDY